MTPAQQTICLNMIVKNEAHVIGRCLESVKPIIDYWVIVDTGSTDGTQELIREIMRGTPGELHERPWIDFAHNRSEALALARDRADYTFVIDADEVIHCEPGFALPELTADAYNLQVRYGGCSYMRKQLVRNTRQWVYQGVLHEYITCNEKHSEGTFGGIMTIPRHDGARAKDPLTYRRDALTLERALLDDPHNTRYQFYLAQSYRDAGDLELAIRHYKKRVEMGGWPEEVWYSLYQIAHLMERSEKPWPEVMEAYLTAHQASPDRAGPLFRIAMHYQGKAQYHAAYVFLSRAAAIPPPADNRLFVERAIYEYQLAVEYAVAAHYAGDYEIAIRINNQLLRDKKLPAHGVEQVVRNRRFSIDVLAPASPIRIEPPPLTIVIDVNDTGSVLDDCIDALLQQDFAQWQAFVIGSIDRSRCDDPRFSIVDRAPAFDDHSIVLRLRATDRLASPDVLAQIRTAFSDPNCHLAYAQSRTSRGDLGNSEPAPSAAEFQSRRGALADESIVAMRGNATWDNTAFEHARFHDNVWTITAAPPIEVVRRPLDEALRNLPKISCLMVTYDRLALAKRSIQSYTDQTYPNRELVIVTDGSTRFRSALERYVAETNAPNVRFVYPPQHGLTLGALRNISMAAAQGEIICQWDDDDCSHPDRLLTQAAQMLRSNARASFLTDHLQLLADQRMLCWVDWTIGGAQGPAQLAPGTLMMFRDPQFVYPEEGPLAKQGEDSVLLARIHAQLPVAHVSGAGYLWLYEYHGRNTFSREHHYHLSNFRKPAAQIQDNAQRISEALTYYGVPKPIVVVGQEGPVFAFN